MEQNIGCPNCGSTDIMPHVRIVDHGHGHGKMDLSVEIHENPDALVFKGTHEGALTARICGNCGYTELFVSNPRELWSIYQSRRSS